MHDTRASVGGRAVRAAAAEVVAAYYRPTAGQSEPLEAVSLLGSGGLGANVVTIGDSGYGEWLGVACDSIRGA